MAIHQHLLHLVELCVRKGIRQAVISPGSRSAPLTLALARHPEITTRVVADERSAGFIAVGIAQQIRQPVIVVCTSGSAVYNLAPAVAEAYFQEIPLLVLTADRPKEWTHQLDGQTIYQTDIFGKHVKQSFELPADYVHPDARWFAERVSNEAINLARTEPRGPVHINLPLREPLYPTADETFEFGPVRVIEQLSATPALSPETWHRLQDEWESAERKLIAVGQGPHDPALLAILKKISEEWRIPVVGDVISNLPRNGEFITQPDVFLNVSDTKIREERRPDLLITCGQSFISKQFKLFLRSYPPRQHWQIQPHTRLADPFQSLTRLIPYEPTAFFEKLFSDIDYQRFVSNDDETDSDNSFQEKWQTLDRKATRLVKRFLIEETVFHEWAVVQRLLDALPTDSQLHVANSMPVRYVNLSGLDENQRVEVFANRGTSGIDGCLSTAVGAALTTLKTVTALIGDVAFFYDRNALWNNLVPNNLRVIVLNNHGGNIFRIIDGPSRQPELDAYFETSQPLSAENTAKDAGMIYRKVTSYSELKAALPDFFTESDRPKLLEIETDRRTNAEQFSRYKHWVQEFNSN
ncbi:2-succinyl-5-enolpyruvyl-6-hydroxy-3-cyclohexene-1-carboxylate synthase [Larkinella arboricola]|uniref:2-succinyl-5-enolpyruvyl-6-hydroxy-3-cyclohexene-1-carboxylate synthase n=1 Tax=Larkinella arboricola TaxID=643671 RepID=A0A327X460_LARAB|nr:2-succinyl-5-enolpyruvyl-6-hydroxy-3-cyclohexene-1-carboxylic-acid synthase [Larkinella arboricola]RAK00479.1 2-succinyl-5-enolpyruvyl-6-hydroxy-3-cyclohexene-1-carboxylate synthase [Larkinella arboricola]